MTDLVAVLSTGKGTWKAVLDLMKAEEWGQVILIGPDFAKDKLDRQDVLFVVIDRDKPTDAIAKDIAKVLREAVKDTEVALNLVSGSGKEHMAVLSGIMLAGLGFRMVESSGKGLQTVGF